MRRVPPLLYLAPAAAVVVLVALVPVGLLVARAFADAPSGLAEVLGDPLDRAAIGNSAVQGVASAAGAVAAGYPLGIWLGRYAGWGRSAVRAVVLVPFLLPSVVMAFAVEGLFGPTGFVGLPLPALRVLGGGVGGIVIANVAFNLPIVALLTAAGVESSPAELEEAAASLGAGPLRRFRDVWGPPSLAGAIAGGLLTFVFSALAFAAPIVLCGARCYTIEARIWSLDTILLQPTAAALLAFVLVVLLVAPTLAYLELARRLRRAGPRGRSVRRPVRGAGPWAITVGAMVGLGLLLAVIGAVVLRSIDPSGGSAPDLSGWTTLGAPALALRTGIPLGAAALNTVAFATASALTALLLGVVAGFALVERPAAGRLLQLVAFVPLLLSPVVLAFALSSVGRAVVGTEGVWALVVGSQTVLALPFALQTLAVPLRHRPRTGREAARVLGAGPFRAYLDADVAGVRSAVGAAALFAFAISLGEFTATYFLTSVSAARFATLPVLLYELQSPGVRAFAAADALAAVLVVLSVVVLAVVGWGGRRLEL